MKIHSVDKKSSEIFTSEELPVRYDIYYPKEARSLNPVLFLHGFKGFKDWGHFPVFCRDLASSGYAVIALNFSKNGTDEKLTELNQMDLFRKQTLSGNLDEVGLVIQAIDKGKISIDGCRLNSYDIGIIGHSRGGTTAAAAAAEYREISALVTWATVSDFSKFWSKDLIRQWENEGVAHILNARTGQLMPVDKVVYQDSITQADRVAAINRITEVHAPSLFIHGSADEGVHPNNSRQLWKQCPAEDKELLIIEGAGHTFGSAHPPEDNNYPEHFQKLADATIEWFTEYL